LRAEKWRGREGRNGGVSAEGEPFQLKRSLDWFLWCYWQFCVRIDASAVPQFWRDKSRPEIPKRVGMLQGCLMSAFVIYPLIVLQLSELKSETRDMLNGNIQAEEIKLPCIARSQSADEAHAECPAGSYHALFCIQALRLSTFCAQARELFPPQSPTHTHC
jgi:hypothetical protein